MFIACPHCRYLVATDPRGQHAPGHCPRCGGVLGDIGARDDGRTIAPAGDTAGGGPSLARLLRRDEIVDGPVPATTGEIDAIASETASAESGVIAVGEVEPPASADMPSEEDAVEVEAATLHSEALSQAPAGSLAASPAEAIIPPDSEPIETRAIATSATAAPARLAARAPSFLHGQAHARKPSRVPRWQWASLIVLAAVLVLQVLLADRARLAADAGWRPVLASLCNALGCSLPPWREPQAFAMLDRDVRPVPGAPGVLLAQATFRNDARWAQSWPVLMLTLKDADGRTLGARALRPAEYLPRDGAASTTIAPGQSAQVAIRVREPSANVVAFSFDFR